MIAATDAGCASVAYGLVGGVAGACSDVEESALGLVANATLGLSK